MGIHLNLSASQPLGNGPETYSFINTCLICLSIFTILSPCPHHAPGPGSPSRYTAAAAAAAAAKLLQFCPTLCDPIDGSPPGSPVPGILQARTLE